MTYLINVFLSYLYFFICEKNKIKNNFILYIPIIFIWTLIIGGQYDVGTDYFLYLKIFNGEKNLELFKRYNEYIFYYFVQFFSNLFQEKQYLFFIISFIENILFFGFIFELKKEKIINKISIFIFLFLVYGTVFYNQMNTIRQYFDIYILSLIIFYFYKNKKIMCIILYCIGINIHKSFRYFLVLPILTWATKIINNKKILKISLIITLIILFFPIEDTIKKLASYTSYANYIYRIKELPLQNKITKIIFVPFYLDAINLIDVFKQEKQKLFFLKIGIICFILRILLLTAYIVHRFGEYFGIITILPIYYLIEEYYKNKKYIKLLILLFLIIFLFIAKVLVSPKGEYLYDSWFFI